MLTVAGDIVTPGGVLSNGAIVIDDAGRIAEVSAQRRSPPRSEDWDAPGCLIMPGFVDLHVHGGGGADFMDARPEAVRHVARTHARFGTTSLLATTLTASREATDAAITAVREVMESGRGDDEARVLGLHLEGPYICAKRRGAQPAAFVRPPDLNEFAHWVSLSGGNVRQITLAPELEGAAALVKAARAAGVVVSVGHTDATAAQVLEAMEWGAGQGTHIFNAMPPLHHRAPGAAGAVLACPELVAEVVADGVHLDPLIVRLVFAAKGPDGVALITDAMAGVAMPDGEYALGGFPVFVHDGTARFADGTLAGSVLTMNRAFSNACRFAHLSPAQASRAASLTPARQLGLAEQRGTLEIGKDADFVALHPVTGEVEWTLIGGRVAYRR